MIRDFLIRALLACCIASVLVCAELATNNEATAQNLPVTERFLRQQLSESAGAIDVIGGVDAYLNALAMAAPHASPVPEARGALISVRDVQRLEDGRIGAIVTIAISPVVGGSGTQDNLYIFDVMDDQLLIDSIESAVPDGDE